MLTLAEGHAVIGWGCQVLAVWETLASTAHRDREQIEEEAACAWLERELRETDREIMVYVRQYGVRTPDEIEEKIRVGRIEGHPAWEDSIAWSNLLTDETRRKPLALAMGTSRLVNHFLLYVV